MLERYMPSEEEVAKAEDSMTPEQEEASYNREEYLESGKASIRTVDRPFVYYDNRSNTLTVDNSHIGARMEQFIGAAALGEIERIMYLEKMASKTYINRIEVLRDQIKRDVGAKDA